MTKSARTRCGVVFLSGLALGTLFGLGMLVGALVAGANRGEAPVETVIHATATHGTDTFAMATGPVGESAEGLFILDFLTGDLQCLVPYTRNPRTPGSFGAKFTVNVINDLGTPQGKKPNFLLVTGGANFNRAAGNIKPANGIVYVADANTGVFAAYMIPWSSALETRLQPQGGNLVLIEKGKARNLEIRDQVPNP